MPLPEAFELFASMLQERLALDEPISEDVVRYTFFHALVSGGHCHHTEILLELPHPAIPGAEIDLLVRAGAGRPAEAFEFKYDRAIPSGRNQPRTQKAGAAFKDLFRLARIPTETAQERYFIYLTGPEMATYWRNNLNRIFNLKTDETYPITAAWIEGQAGTFRRIVGDLTLPCSLAGAFQKDLPRQHYLRIYRVGG